jgi:cyclohexa-1,5-dienecarbonyl-CoA hydratase
MPETIHIRSEDRTAWVTLDRPPLNIIDIPMMRALRDALKQLIPLSDFIVFQGAGPKGFSAGVEIRDHTPERVKEMLETFHSVFHELGPTDCITIAAVHGQCLGGGMELATFCDFVLATESAKFGQPEIKLGCFPPVAIVILPQLIGLRAALDLILTGRIISATEAQRLGLITRVVPDDALPQALESLLAEFRALSSVALRMARHGILHARKLEIAFELTEMEGVYLDELMKTEDAAEGIRAFLEKRAPLWRGR